MTALEAIRAEIAGCTRCPLSQGRTLTVPGEGPADAEILFVGEGPGFHEDRQGRPFVGPAGQLLVELLASIGLRREHVFIANVVKCRPPNNRDPEPAEIAACNDYLDRQIAALDPKVIATLGRFSMAKFLPGVTISRVHGQPRRDARRVILPLFHPAAALRQPGYRTALFEDFKKIPTLLEEVRQARLAADRPVPAEPKQLSLF